MLQRYLLVWLTLLSLAAFYWPGWTAIGFDPFAQSKPYLLHLFAVTMFAIGAMLPRDEIREVFRRWPTVLGGTTVQYVAMPLTAYMIGHAFGYQGDLLLGIILVGCVPGAMASNVLTLSAGGNVSYSVSLTTSATLLSPLVVPATLYLTTRQSNIDTEALVRQAFFVLTTQVVGPVVAGHLLARRFGTFESLMRRVGPTVANLVILWIIAVVVNANHERLTEVGPRLAGALLAINLAGYGAGFLAARGMRLPEPMRRALTLEIGLQNAGLGSVLATQLFPDAPAVALPPALYTFGCMLTGTILAQIWSLKSAATKAESGEGKGESQN